MALSEPDIAVSIALGIGLAAATGFRVFLPLLVVGIAGRTGYPPLGEEFAWLSATTALVMLAVAALVEIFAYYIPSLDHLLDMIATPAAVAAGIVVAAAVVTDLPPTLKWTLAIIAEAVPRASRRVGRFSLGRTRQPSRRQSAIQWSRQSRSAGRSSCRSCH